MALFASRLIPPAAVDAALLQGDTSLMEATLDYAETHFAQILRHVTEGGEVILRKGDVPVAKIVPIASSPSRVRPQAGVVTSAPVQWEGDCFDPLDEQGMRELGLL